MAVLLLSGVDPFETLGQCERELRHARERLLSQLPQVRDRRRGPLIRDIHRITRMLEESPRYFSQNGQDRIVDQLLGEKNGGVFVDIGGYDGVEGSNTLFFEAFRRWNGILVEAAPTQLEKACSVRCCPCLGCAVAGEPGEAEFMEVTSGFTQMSGFLDSYERSILDTVRANPSHDERLHRLEKRTLASILDEQGLERVDYLSLDVEGSELGILESFPFERFEIDIWSIENNTQTDAIPELMKARGYRLVEFAGNDDIFRRTG